MKIRKARGKRLAAALKLERAFFPDTPAYGTDAHWWLVEDAEGPCAFGVLRILAEEPTVGYLARAAVSHRARGRGLQCKLIKIRERAARKLGIKWLITYTDYDNTTSANNLIRCGYRLYVPSYKWGWASSYYFRKELK